MNVTIGISEDGFLTIEGTKYPKGYVELFRYPDGVRLAFSYNGELRFPETLLEEVYFDNGDDPEDVQPYSMNELQNWWDLNANELYPKPRPFYYVTDDTANEVLVKAGKGLLHHLSAINTSTAVRYLKIYDKPEQPNNLDEPKAIYALPGKSVSTYLRGIAGEEATVSPYYQPPQLQVLITSELAFGFGLCFVISDSLTAHNAGTPGEVIVNIIHQ